METLNADRFRIVDETELIVYYRYAVTIEWDSGPNRMVYALLVVGYLVYSNDQLQRHRHHRSIGHCSVEKVPSSLGPMTLPLDLVGCVSVQRNFVNAIDWDRLRIQMRVDESAVGQRDVAAAEQVDGISVDRLVAVVVDSLGLDLVDEFVADVAVEAVEDLLEMVDDSVRVVAVGVTLPELVDLDSDLSA